MDIKKMTLAVSSTSKEQDCYVKYCRELGMEPEWVNQVFQHKLSKAKFKLLGLKKAGRLFTVWVEPVNKLTNSIYATSYSIKQFMDNCHIIHEGESINEN